MVFIVYTNLYNANLFLHDMNNPPLSVAIAALIHDNKILMIKRSRGSYAGLLGLPGGKVEKNEHLSEAVTREVLEEAGIESTFKKHLGFVSEHLVEDSKVIQHFLLHVCELEPHSTEVTESSEGELEWFDLDRMEEMKEQIIPSDLHILNNLVKKREKEYYNCVIEKSGEDYELKKFE